MKPRALIRCGFPSIRSFRLATRPLFRRLRDGQLPEHYNRWADPFIALTVAATVTTKVKLGTGICLLPEREPLVTAKTIASLDLYSGGRVVIGAGAGWLREETEVLGTEFRLRWKRMRETVEAMKVLWTQPEAAYEGDLGPVFRPSAVSRNPPSPAGRRSCSAPTAPRHWNGWRASYDGWFPLVQSPDSFDRQMTSLRQLTREAGRDPDGLHITIIVDPGQGGPSQDELKRYRDAGAQGVVTFSQQMGTEIADGGAMAWIDRVLPTVERAQRV